MSLVPAQALICAIWGLAFARGTLPFGGLAMRTSMLMDDAPRSVKTTVLVGALTIALFVALSLTIVLVPASVSTSGVAGEEDGPYTQLADDGAGQGINTANQHAANPGPETQLADAWAWQGQRVGSPTAAA